MEEIVFPNQIRMLRRMRGKTMKSLADVLNISLSAVSKIEKGYRAINEQQLQRIVSFLDCPKESVFVYETTSQPEVVHSWKKEQERRKKINETSGLKTLGAGLRYLRGQKQLTLQDVARGAHMTLSVYHRIEMGQREVDEAQLQRIAHALGLSTEALQMQVYELDMAGALKAFKKGDKPGIFHSKGGYNDLPMNEKLLYTPKIALVGQEDTQGRLIPDPDHPVDMLEAEFLHIPALYAVVVSAVRLGFPCKRVMLFVDKSLTPSVGDLAVFYTDNQQAMVGYLQQKKDALCLVNRNPDMQYEVSQEQLKTAHKVTYIHFL